MLNHQFTLSKITKDFQYLCGCELVAIFSQEKETLILTFDDGEMLHYVEVSILNKRDTIFIRTNFARAKSNVQDIFYEVKNEILQEVSLIHNDRIIHFKFVNRNIWVLLFGNGKSNIILTSSHNKILASFKNKKELLNTNYIPIKRDIYKLVDIEKNITLKEAINKSDFFFGKYYLNELAFRFKLDLSLKLSEISKEELIRIQNLSYQFKGECINSNIFYHLDVNSSIPLLSLIELNGYNVKSSFENISEAIQRKISQIHFVEDIEKEKAILTTYFDKIIRLNINTVNKIKDLGDVNDRIAQCRQNAEILMSQTNLKVRLGDNLSTLDWNKSPINIKLNPKLNLLDNAQKYFNKAKGLNKENEILLKRLPEAENKVKFATEALEKLFNISTFVKIKEFKSEYISAKPENKNKIALNLESKFRKFVIDEKNTLYVGKNAETNDELTQKFAKPNDIWLHARGVGGSHCVLKTIGGKAPTKESLERAAEISAYYSQARGGSYVPVAYCQKKYVRKPKGANIGAVIMQKEEVIMVEPKLN